MEDKPDEDLERLMAQIEVKQGVMLLKEIMPQCMDLQNVMAKLMHNFYSTLCKEGFSKSQAIDLIKTHGTGLNTNING